MKKTLLCSVFLLQALTSLDLSADSTQLQQDQTALDLKINHQVLWQSPTSTITSFDLVKQIDLLLLHQGQSIPRHLKAEYYRNYWSATLQNMIERDLVLQQARERGFKIERYEVMEEISRRLGSDYIVILDRENIALNDLIDDIEKELLVQRMIYIKVQYKAQRAITPGAVREHYKQYLAENPEKELLSLHLYTLKQTENTQDSELFQALGSLQETIRSNGALSQSQVDDLSTELIPLTRLEFKEITKEGLNESLAKRATSLSNEDFTSWSEDSTTHKRVMKVLHLYSREKRSPRPLTEMRTEIEDMIFQKNLQIASKEFLEKLYDLHKDELQELQRRLEANEINPFS